MSICELVVIIPLTIILIILIAAYLEVFDGEIKDIRIFIILLVIAVLLSITIASIKCTAFDNSIKIREFEFNLAKSFKMFSRILSVFLISILIFESLLSNFQVTIIFAITMAGYFMLGNILNNKELLQFFNKGKELLIILLPYGKVIPLWGAVLCLLYNIFKK